MTSIGISEDRLTGTTGATGGSAEKHHLNRTPMKELKVRLERYDGGKDSPSKRSIGMDVDETNKRCKPEIIARKEQFDLLNTLFSNEPSNLPACVFIWGSFSSGKSFTLDMAIDGKNFHVVRIHCAEILCGRRAFYETLVKQLVRRISPEPSPDFKCDSLQSLFSNISQYFEKSATRSLKHVFIVKGAENLRGESDDILQFLVSLQNVTQAPLCVAFVSTLPPRQFMPNIMDHSIIPVFFPQYSMEELVQILIQQQHSRSGISKDAFYPFYIKMVVSMFYYVCRDLRKLSRLATSHWDTFGEMAKNLPEGNYTKMWKTLEPKLKAQFSTMNSAISCVNLTASNTAQESISKNMDMPVNAKYLLIASYLATHNPSSTDKRFFVKSKTGKMKKIRAIAKTDINQHTRTFELNRLNAIFGSIQAYCDDNATNKNRNISFLTLLTTLVQNKLIQHLGEDSFGNQKYRCLLDYDTVLEISRSINFELNNYLYRLM